MNNSLKQLPLIIFILFLFFILMGCSAQTQDVADSPTPDQSHVTSPPSGTVPTEHSATPANDEFGSRIVWTDPVVEKAVRQCLGKPDGATITEEELQTITSISLGNDDLMDLTDLKYLGGIEELELSVYVVTPSEQPLDLSPIGGLNRLKRLELCLSGDSYDLSFLQQLPYLTSLTIQWPSNGIDISAISALSDLTHLGLIEMEGLDLYKLAGMTQLTKLYLKFCDVENLEPLKTLVNLNTLGLQDSKRLVSLAPIAGMKDLAFLDLTACSNIESLEPLSALKNLKELFIPGNLGIDITPITHVEYINGQRNDNIAP